VACKSTVESLEKFCRYFDGNEVSLNIRNGSIQERVRRCPKVSGSFFGDRQCQERESDGKVLRRTSH